MATNAMGWRRGPMAGKSTLQKVVKLGARRRESDRYRKSALVLDQRDAKHPHWSAAYALWHWLVIHDRSFVGINPEALVDLASGGKEPAHVTIELLVNYLKAHGVLSAVYWSDRADHLQQALAQGMGPILVGSPWMEGMLRPSLGGFIEPAGKCVGRHVYLVVGYDEERGAFRILNSWGQAWGQLGRAWITGGHLQALLRNGQACVPQISGRNAGDRARWVHLLLQDRG